VTTSRLRPTTLNKVLCRILAAALTVAAAGCGEDTAPPGGVSADEARQLNQAADILDVNGSADTPANEAGAAE
jgi:hypothetical protein